jgi:hypothetical protein
MSAIIPRSTVTEICAHRVRALELYGEAVAALDRANDAYRAACQIGGPRSLPSIQFDRFDTMRADGFLDEIRKRLNRDMWRGIVLGTPIGSLMDAAEADAFRDSLEKDPPDATEETVRATLERLVGESDMIFRRGLVNAFKALDRDYASNDGFKIGERIVLTWGVTWDKIMGYFTFRSERQKQFHDLDRVMHVLDGKPAPDRNQGLCSAMDSLTYSRGRDAGTIAESDYWRIRIFKNGNVHLWAKRADLLERCNRLIAEHFGNVVPAGHKARDAAPDYQPAPDRDLKADFFATPQEIAEQAIAAAEIPFNGSVLEPSAGDGALARAARDAGGVVECIEIHLGRARDLIGDGFPCVARDFLKSDPDPRFDRVVMNPPFSDLQDVRHVSHALKFLRPGGRLVAIMSPAIRFRSDRLTSHLRAELEGMGATIEDLPEGAFKASGTMVRTVLVTVDAPK